MTPTMTGRTDRAAARLLRRTDPDAVRRRARRRMRRTLLASGLRAEPWQVDWMEMLLTGSTHRRARRR